MLITRWTAHATVDGAEVQLDAMPAHRQGVQMQTKKTLCNIKGISEAKIEKIREAAKKITVCSAHGPVSHSMAWSSTSGLGPVLARAGEAEALY